MKKSFKRAAIAAIFIAAIGATIAWFKTGESSESFAEPLE